MRTPSTRLPSLLCSLLVVAAACSGSDAAESADSGGMREMLARMQAGAGEERDPCTLVPLAELERIREGELFDGERDGSSCFYPAKRKNGRLGMHYLTITAESYGGREALESWRAGASLVDRTTREATGLSGMEAGGLSGLGDEAFFVRTGIMDFLVARKGDAYVKIEAAGPPEQAVEIARLALAEL